MMRNTLAPLLPQILAPLFQLRGDRLNSGGLFDGVGFDASGLKISRLRFPELHHGIFSAFIEPFAEFF